MRRGAAERLAMALAALAAAGCGGGTDPGPGPGPGGGSTPTLAASVPIPANYGIHDTFVRDGLAFVSAWGTGLIIYDVGNGMRGGSPTAPVEVGRVVTSVTNPSGSPSTHNSWWFHNPVTAEKRYLFVGEEGPGAIGSSASGDIHVVDVTDLAHPAEVAHFHLPEALAGNVSTGTHNFWMDEPAQVLYAAYYNGGVVAIDVSGTLTGDISGRLIAQSRMGGAASTYTWGVMLANGSLYASDMESGLWQLTRTGGTFTTAGGSNVPERFTSDLWVRGNFAYTGTWGSAQRQPGVPGNAIKVWQLGAGGAPTLVDSIIFGSAGTVSDLEVSADGGYMLATLEIGPAAGFQLLAMTNPAKPGPPLTQVAVQGGVHTGTTATIGGRKYVFLAKNPPAPALLIYDVTALVP